MKLRICLFIIFFPCLLFGQYQIKEKLPALGVLVFSGAWDGVGEKVKWKYKEFKMAFPKAKDHFWNPELSWRNKYEFTPDGQIGGERFPGSTTVFVFATDGYHLSRTISKTTGVVGAVWLIGKKQKWYYYVFDFLLYSAARGIGFHLTYSLI
jgi:hypothetical protein